jgi:tetratricopeptide (TPR) repeat protein
MPPKKKGKAKSQGEPKKTKPSVEIKESRGFVIGDFAKVVNNFISNVDEKVLKRLGIEQKVGFLLLGLLVIGGFTGIYFGLRQNKAKIMTGEFRIAIASFAETGRNLPDHIGYTVADGINIRLASDLHEITGGPIVTIWGPDQVGTLKGTTAQARAESAEKLANKIQAHMIIYGVIEETSSGMLVTPEFYLHKQGFHEGSEVIGQYALGSPFPLPGADNPAWQFNFDKQMQTRTDIVSSLAEGLSYLAVHEYGTALEKLQDIESVEGWQEDQGKEVLYALIGFAAGKAGQYELTRSMLERAIAINPEYARPYIGMANLNYVLALQPVEESSDIQDVDQALLDECFKYLEQAVQAPEKPPLADVDTKIHFSRGQCYWLKTYSGQLPDYSLAINEFEQVIDAFADGKNPRLHEFAAESHARLGLIHKLTDNLPEALIHYQKAVELLADDPERQAVFQQRVDEIKRTLPQPTP